MRYILDNLDKYDIDINHIGLYGSSQGGHMAIGVAMEMADRGESD